MGLYKLFSYNVEVQYKSCFLSKAMLFTLTVTLLNIILPFIVAYRSRGFWLKSHYFYEQPVIHFTYEYLLVVETEDPSKPIVCSETAALSSEKFSDEEYCAEIQVQENDYNGDGKNDILEFKFHLNIPSQRTVTSVLLMIALDFQLRTLCSLHMQSLAIMNREFPVPPSGWKYYGDLQLYQTVHLPCLKNIIDTKYNTSMFGHMEGHNHNVLDFILEKYFIREVTTQTKTIHSRGHSGHTGNINLNIHLRVPEMKVRYTPNFMQEFKWAWPQYLSLVVIFYWIFNKIKKFVFNNRLLMAWEILPWRKC